MNPVFNSRYPSVEDLRIRARGRIPRFAFDYLDGGCNEDINLEKNNTEIRKVELLPVYLRERRAPKLQTQIMGLDYNAPFGIAPIGLQGLIWPGAAEILARAATEHQIPFILSTVSTASVERIAAITGGNAWFQLYHPVDPALRNDLVNRARDAGFPVLVVLCDVPSFGFRPRDIRNGLSMPPKMNFCNILQILRKTSWAINTLRHGIPTFATLKKYMPPGMNLSSLGEYMDKTFSGHLDADRIAAIRDRWKGKLVLKGVASAEDAETAIRLGVDGVIVSNHGGRQLDAGQSAIAAMREILPKVKGKVTIMMDSGVRSGPDIGRCLACGADFVFLGRSFMYGVAALGRQGGAHVTALLIKQLTQIMEQVGCERISDFPEHLIDKNRFL